MKAGDLIQIQKSFRIQQCGRHVIHSLSDYELFPSLTLQPGEVYLMTEYYFGKEEHPIYSYFDITLLAEGKKWETTITVDDISEVDDYIRVVESPTLSQRR